MSPKPPTYFHHLLDSIKRQLFKVPGLISRFYNGRRILIVRLNWRLIFVLSFVFTILSFKTITFPFILDAESTLQTLSEFKATLNKSVLKNWFYQNDFIEDNFLLINTTNDLALTHTPDNNNGTLTKSITDRSKLAALFKYLSENDTSYNYVVCDLFFDFPYSPSCRGDDGPHSDDSLAIYINALVTKKGGSKILFAARYDPQGNTYLDPSHFNGISQADMGYTNLQPISGLLRYFTLEREGCRASSLPLMMLARLNRDTIVEFIPGSGILRVSDHGEHYFCLNSYIPEMLFNTDDMEGPQKTILPENSLAPEKMPLMDLNEAINYSQLGPGALESFLGAKNGKKKNIFIGAFKGQDIDNHQTIYGMRKGPFIILNTYYSLLKRQNKISLFLCLFLLFSYFIIFSIAGDEEEGLEGPKFKISNPIIKEIYSSYRKNRDSFILLTMTLFVLLVFNIVMNFIILEVFLLLVKLFILRDLKQPKA